MKDMINTISVRVRSAAVGTIAATGLIAAPMAATSALAQEDFYSGKTITIYVGFGPGGGYDTYARLAAEFLGEHILGNPNVIVENMPGAGGRTAAQHIYAVAPQDGTALSVVVQSIALDSVLGTLPTELDANQLNAIGRLTTDYGLGMLSASVDADTLDDVKGMPLTFASTGAGSATSFVPKMLNDMEGTNFTVIQGYQSSAAALLALESGEVDAAMQGYATVSATKPDWIPDGVVNVLWLVGLEPVDDLPGVPPLAQLGETQRDTDALALVSAASDMARSLFAPPNVPEDRIELLRTAFMKMVEDPDFIAAASDRGLNLDPTNGERLQEIVRAQMEADQEVIEYVRPYVLAE